MSKLTIYMKSGNTIELKGVKDWEVRATDESVVYLKIKYRTGLFAPKNKLIITTITLSQIEAIVKG